MYRNFSFRSNASTSPSGKFAAMDCNIRAFRSASDREEEAFLTLEDLRLPEDARTTATMPAAMGGASRIVSYKVPLPNEAPAICEKSRRGDNMSIIVGLPDNGYLTGLYKLWPFRAPYRFSFFSFQRKKEKNKSGRASRFRTK